MNRVSHVKAALAPAVGHVFSFALCTSDVVFWRREYKTSVLRNTRRVDRPIG